MCGCVMQTCRRDTTESVQWTIFSAFFFSFFYFSGQQNLNEKPKTFVAAPSYEIKLKIMIKVPQNQKTRRANMCFRTEVSVGIFQMWSANGYISHSEKCCCHEIMMSVGWSAKNTQSAIKKRTSDVIRLKNFPEKLERIF